MLPVPPEIRADRRLLVPGPYPPLTHLGATLLRHAAHSALRYALYQIGEDLPESPPTRFVALRLYFDTVALGRVLDGSASREVLGALVDPGGVAGEPLPRRLRGVLWFHRQRLLARASALGRLVSKPRASGAPPSSRPGAVLSRCLPALGDALLGDLVAALDRRQERAAGRAAGPVQSSEAARFLRAARVDLSRLGPPDPIAPSWSEVIPPPALQPASEVLSSCPEHRLRGGFREQYRHLLDRVRPSLLALGDRAVDKGYLSSCEDVFFIPFDLLDDLDSSIRPNWLDAAVASNRAEWEEVRSRHAPADTLGDVAPASRLDLPPALAPLWPLE